MQTKSYLSRSALLLGLLLLVGCGNEMEALTDTDLQDRVYQCKRTTTLSPGQAITCENYQRECQRRRKEGRYAC